MADNISKRDHRASQSDEWEDVDTKVGERRFDYDSEQPSPAPASPSTTPRKRKPKGRTVFVAASSPRKPTPIPRARPATARTPTATTTTLLTEEELRTVFLQSARSSGKYVYDILGSFFYLIKKPLAFFLVIWVIAVILNVLAVHLRAVFSPLCILPGMSHSWLCASPMSPSVNQNSTRHADYPAMVEIQSKTFEQLLDESVSGSGLAMEIKKAEMATTDLVTLVRVSKLTSKDLLANSLTDFVDNARGTARGLQKLSSKVSGAVDNILAINDYALRTIEGADAKPSLVHYLWPFSSSSSSTNELLTSTFSQSLGVLSGSLQRLILEAQSSLHSLEKLEYQLQTIHDVLAREGVQLTSAHADLLAELWTRLGGNRAQLRSFGDNLRLLRELGNYRTRALAHVVAALQALEALSADMEELRERVAAPELAGGEIPLEVHVRSIRSGIERLNEGRIRAREKEEQAMQRILGPIDG